jgi:tRNA (guanine-N7-)-methyltransferase
MARTKRQRIIEVKHLPNVFTIDNENILDDLNQFWGNKNPVSLEIGCGQADYSNGLSKIYPERNFLGVDIKGARIYTAAKKAINESIKNVCFYFGRVEDLLLKMEPASIEKIFIPFPDPRVKRRSEKRRLISNDFFNLYKNILKENGIIQLKTDDSDIYEQALNAINYHSGRIQFLSENVTSDELSSKPDYIITKYENHYREKGRAIKLVEFNF